MSKFRDESNIETVKGACPICKGDVKGNDIYKYFCVNCNILFTKDDLVITREAIHDILKEKIVEKFSSNPDAIKIEDSVLETKKLTDKQKELLNNRKKKEKPKVKKPRKKKSDKKTE
ncbi:MAG TPA: hypothetical protein VEC16_02395 [Alphaproteobacteria bacterium]|nr:hypothetical protein [Alphaproteobacteria bacterium]